MSSDPGVEESRILAMLIEHGQLELEQQSATSDSHGVRALGLLAANAAFVVLGLTVIPHWSPWWLVPIALAIVSAVAYGWILIPRDFNLGPNVEQFYYWAMNEGKLFLDAQQAMLSQLVTALSENARLGKKALGFWVGTIALVLELLSGFVLRFQGVGW